jgi:tripartite-type tricarboxylate transporter receptor subunit TctC
MLARRRRGGYALASEEESMKTRATAGVVLALAAALAQAQGFPSRPIRVVVPFPAGGTDVTARIITTKMAEYLGQPLVVENRAGANGNIGSDYVAKSPPDGYTLLVTTSSTMVAGFLLKKNVPFDPVRDFTPIGNMYEAVQTLSVAARVPATNLRELIDYAKKNPGKLNFGSIGTGSAYHLNGEIFKRAAGVDIVHVPYKGTAPMTVALLAGEVDMAFPSLSNLGGNLNTGKVKVLAMLDPRRHPRVPDVPPIQDTLPNFRKAANWIAMFGPAGLPAPVTTRLSSELQKALAAPDVRSAVEKVTSVIIGGSADELAATLKSDLQTTAQLIKEIGLKPE